MRSNVKRDVQDWEIDCTICQVALFPRFDAQVFSAVKVPLPDSTVWSRPVTRRRTVPEDDEE